MSISSCARTWEVEAARDGRLTGAELASFERHASSCAACRAEATVLDGLGQSLRALREPLVDEVAIRRRKLRLLREADEAAMGEVSSRRPLRQAFAVAGALSVLA